MRKREPEDYGRLLTMQEAADRMRLSVWTLRRMALRGELMSCKVGSAPGRKGGKRLVPELEVNNWIERNLRSA